MAKEEKYKFWNSETVTRDKKKQGESREQTKEADQKWLQKNAEEEREKRKEEAARRKQKEEAAETEKIDLLTKGEKMFAENDSNLIITKVTAPDGSLLKLQKGEGEREMFVDQEVEGKIRRTTYTRVYERIGTSIYMNFRLKGEPIFLDK